MTMLRTTPLIQLLIHLHLVFTPILNSAVFLAFPILRATSIYQTNITTTVDNKLVISYHT